MLRVPPKSVYAMLCRRKREESASVRDDDALSSVGAPERQGLGGAGRLAGGILSTFSCLYPLWDDQGGESGGLLLALHVDSCQWMELEKCSP